MNERKIGLDGLRGMAITLIVMSHCGILAQGGLGNAIFFTLSGFLAMMPFREDGERSFLSLAYVGRYYLNRIIRIFPTLWVVLLLVWLLFPYDFFSIVDLHSFNSLLLNMFLYKAKHHLWFLQQEIVFYFVLPCVMLLICGLKKLLCIRNYGSATCNLVIACMAFCVSLLCYKYRSTDLFYLWGNWIKQHFRIEQFLIGIATGYLYRAAIEGKKKILSNNAYKIICIIYSILFLAFCFFSSNYFLVKWNESYADFLVGWELPMLCSILTGGFLLAILTLPKVYINIIFENRLFVYLGKLSYVIYLTHWFFIPLFEMRGVVTNFLLIYVVTIGFSIILHALVEKPSMILAKTYDFRDVCNYYKHLGANTKF